jgi:Ca-activated chloride channel family protein
VDQFDQMGGQPMADMPAGEEQAAAAALGGRPVMGPGFAIMEQRLRQAEGDPTLLMRNQFRMGEMELMRQSGGRLRESRPW